MRSIFTQVDHDEMVRNAVNFLRNNGYTNIKAHLSGFDTPSLIRWEGQYNGHIPDVEAYGNGRLSLFEVETADTIDDQHTANQWKLFAAHAKNNNGEFWVIVPRGKKYAAEQRIINLGIAAKVWEI